MENANINELESLSDAELIDRHNQTKEGHIPYILIQRYLSEISIYIGNRLRNKNDQQDFLQDLYLDFQQGKLASAKTNPFVAWLRLIIKNKLNDIHRKSHVRNKYKEQERFKPIPSFVTEKRLTIGLDHPLVESQVDGAWSVLNERERVCLELFYDDVGYDKIAEINGITHNQVRGAITRGRRKLRSELKNLASYYKED